MLFYLLMGRNETHLRHLKSRSDTGVDDAEKKVLYTKEPDICNSKGDCISVLKKADGTARKIRYWSWTSNNPKKPSPPSVGLPSLSISVCSSEFPFRSDNVYH